MKIIKRLISWTPIYSLLLVAYTVFTLLDAFVIPHDMVKLSALEEGGEVSAATGETDGSTEKGDRHKPSGSGDATTDGSTEKGGGHKPSGSGDATTDGSSGKGGRHKPSGNGGGPRSRSEDGSSGGESTTSDGETRRRPGGEGSHKPSEKPGGRKESADGTESGGRQKPSRTKSSEGGGNGASDDGTDAQTAVKTPETGTDTYSSDGLTVKLTTKKVNDTYVYVADVVVEDVDSLQAGLAEDTFGRNVSEDTSVIAERLSAVLAINGDYYGFRNAGYVIRNGYLYREKASSDDQEDLVIYKDGSFEIINESEVTAKELLEKGAVQVYSFGPGLVSDGKAMVTAGDEVDKAMSSNPRTAIGMVEAGHYVFVVSDGRTEDSEGLSLAELADVMIDAGCKVAYNLDGGGSSTMYFKGEIVNNPTTNGNRVDERSVSDIVYVK